MGCKFNHIHGVWKGTSDGYTPTHPCKDFHGFGFMISIHDLHGLPVESFSESVKQQVNVHINYVPKSRRNYFHSAVFPKSGANCAQPGSAWCSASQAPAPNDFWRWHTLHVAGCVDRGRAGVELFFQCLDALSFRWDKNGPAMIPPRAFGCGTSWAAAFLVVIDLAVFYVLYRLNCSVSFTLLILLFVQ